ncbi:MAG: lytic transglycosylase domain-containing protein [Ruminococcus sp.]|nr:lytic transglycosylase domain-containing protein [Ruminococcus sp.]
MAQTRRRNRRRRKQRNPKRKLITFIIVVVILGVIGFILVSNFGKAQRFVGSKLYPIKYSEYVDKASEEHGVKKELIYAMIHTESHFNKDAVSSAGAVGLMQLTPETYEWLCKRRNIDYVDGGLYEPSINIDFGTYLIKYLFEEFGDEKLVIAAYNAGPDNVKSWLKNPDYSSDGKTLTNVPYAETEKHIEKVLDAEDKYKKIYFS